MGNGIAGLLGRSPPADLSAYTRFGGSLLPQTISNTIRAAMAQQGMLQQPQPMQQQPFPTYGQYGLLAAQMAQLPQQQVTQGLLPGGMPPSRIPYRPWGK